MKISYSILTHNETDSLSELIQFLVKHKDEEDEIVILDDYSDNEKTSAYLDVVCSIHEIKFEQRHLLKDYAGQKNHLTRMCEGKYIFNLDADELPNKRLIQNIKPILGMLYGRRDKSMALTHAENELDKPDEWVMVGHEIWDFVSGISVIFKHFN